MSRGLGDVYKRQQLQGVIAIDITDPKTATKVAPKYADAVAKALKK